VAQFLKDMLKGVGPSVALGRDTTIMREVLDKTAQRVGNDLNDQPEVQIELRGILADTYHELQLYKSMDETARANLECAQSKLGPESLAVADTLNQLGDALLHRRVLKQAETVNRQAIAMQSKLRGSDSLQEAAALYILSDVLCSQWAQGRPGSEAKLAEAETVARKALAIRKRRLGDQHPDVAKSLDSLSHVLLNQMRAVEAEAAAREGLAMRQNLLDSGHPDFGRSFNSLGDVLAYEGKLAEAETWLSKALKMERTMLGNGSWHEAMTLSSLAGVLQKQGKLPEAEALHRESVAMAKKLMGENHPDVLAYSKNLAGVLRQEGKLAEAEMLDRETLELRKDGALRPDD
jgi:tetratricopeptide (TPR) repeat protein